MAVDKVEGVSSLDVSEEESLRVQSRTLVQETAVILIVYLLPVSDKVLV